MAEAKRPTFSYSTSDSGHFVQSALDALSAHIAILDERGVIVGTNNAWRNFGNENGYQGDADYGVGSNYLHICETAMGTNADEAPMIARGIRQILDGKINEFALEYPCHSPTENRWFVVNITRFVWDGQFRLIIAHQNVTPIKEIQIELENTNKRINAIIQNVANGIITMDENGLIETLNPAAEHIFMVTAAQVIDKPITELFQHPYSYLTFTELVEHIKRNPEYEFTGLRHNGESFPMSLSISRIGSNGNSFFTIIVVDLTGRKRIESAVLEKEKMEIELNKERELREFKNRFIGLMSHELRTPLASIRLSSDLLNTYADRISIEDRTNYLENINLQVEYLSGLFKDMIEISRSEVRDFEYNPAGLELISFCKTIINQFRLNHDKDYCIKFETHQPELVASLDSKLLRHMISNLISNAIKYSPSGGEVRIALDLVDSMIMLSISDDGIGIPKEDQTMLFEPFHRARNVDNLPGSGLGLSIVKQAVDKHNGSIAVDSDVNQGTTFIVKLPFIPSVLK